MKDHQLTCRFCGSSLRYLFADLGMSPLANSYLRADQLARDEPFYPLRAYVCEECFLVQLPVFRSSEDIFSDYAYFSSYSDSWLDHAKRYAASVIDRFGLDERSQVVEIASNDGYLLQYFKAEGIPVLGIEPAQNVADVAVSAGIPTTVRMFGSDVAKNLTADGFQGNLLVGNNVLAHVPALNDFVEGMKILLAPRGVITMEFPHLMRLEQENQFDTIYHEHFSYFSFGTVTRVFSAHGLNIFDVEELKTHGGSLRIYACHSNDDTNPVTAAVGDLLRRENDLGFDSLDHYLSFDKRVKQTKEEILKFVRGIKNDGRSMVGYGAPAKGNTLLNYCGIGREVIEYTVDRSPHKQGLFLPGTHIPILEPDRIRETKPDYVIILPWNLRDEIMEQMAYIKDWGGRFVTFIPEVDVF